MLPQEFATSCAAVERCKCGLRCSGERSLGGGERAGVWNELRALSLPSHTSCPGLPGRHLSLSAYKSLLLVPCTLHTLLSARPLSWAHDWAQGMARLASVSFVASLDSIWDCPTTWQLCSSKGEEKNRNVGMVRSKSFAAWLDFSVGRVGVVPTRKRKKGTEGQQSMCARRRGSNNTELA